MTVHETIADLHEGLGVMTRIPLHQALSCAYMILTTAAVVIYGFIVS